MGRILQHELLSAYYSYYLFESLEYCIPYALLDRLELKMHMRHVGVNLIDLCFLYGVAV